LQVSGIGKSFPKPDGQELRVLEGVNLNLAEGQIVGLLGRSGSGKSTLLRLIAGLAEPTHGELHYLGTPVNGPAPGISMVFQSFALFPWLTVYENVALGLEAQRLPRREVFAAVWQLSHEAAQRPVPTLCADLGSAIPRLSEPWYCCAEPTDQQLQSF